MYIESFIDYIETFIPEQEEKPEDVIGSHMGRPVYRDPEYRPPAPRLYDEEGNYNPRFSDLPTVDPDKDAEMYPPSSQRKDFDQEAADKRREQRMRDLEDPEKTKEMVDRLTNPEVRGEPRQYSDDAVRRVLSRTGTDNPLGVRGRMMARLMGDNQKTEQKPSDDNMPEGTPPDESPARDAVDTPSRPPAQPESMDKYDKILYGAGPNPSAARRKMVDQMRAQDQRMQDRYDRADSVGKASLDALRGGDLDAAIRAQEDAGRQQRVGDIKRDIGTRRMKPRSETQVNTPSGVRLTGMERFIKDNPEYNQTVPIRSAVTGSRLRGLERYRDSEYNPNKGQLSPLSPERQKQADALEQETQKDLDRYQGYLDYSNQLTQIGQDAYKRHMELMKKNKQNAIDSLGQSL